MTHEVIMFSEHHLDGIYDFRGIVKSSKGHVYACQSIQYPEGDYIEWCACIGWRTRYNKNRETSKLYGTCSHFETFRQYMEQNFGENNMPSNIAKTNIQAINEIWGGLPLGILINSFGIPGSGKTTGDLWMGLGRMQDTKKNFLVIDAEKGFADHVLQDTYDEKGNLIRKGWLSIYNEMNGTDFGVVHKKLDFKTWKRSPSTIMPYKEMKVQDKFKGKSLNVHVISIANIKQMLTLIGTPCDIEVGSKFKLIPSNWNVFDGGDILESPLCRYIDDPNGEDEFCGFMVDSLTYLVKFFGTEQQSFPTRDTAQSLIINQLGELLFEYDDMFGIVITHGSKSPADIYAVSRPVGGKSVGHGFKYAKRHTKDVKASKDLNTIVKVDSYRMPSGKGGTGKKIAISNKGVF